MDDATSARDEDEDPSANQGRNETSMERLDRNWNDLLQELRVTQTGVQLLTGFLLTLPFQTRFSEVEDLQRNAYLATVGCAIAATGFLIAPVSLHRLVFRRHLRRRMVAEAHHLALVGMALLACAIVGVVFLTFGLVTGDAGAAVAATMAALLLTVLWVVLPLRMRAHSPERV
ncbi:MAG: DUF6328 family protein [Nocardioidaceae bacterium]